MRYGKTARARTPLPMADSVLSAVDGLTEQFRQVMCNPLLARDADQLASFALSYAAEAEQRILELNARIAHLETMAVTDELTGLLNRRGFDQIMRRNLMSAARHDEAGILAYIDLDGFKGINDRHGHPKGDEVLRAVGRYLQQSVRATDYAARLGGDEFAILFVRAEHSPARERARQIVRGINRLAVANGRTRIPVRASLGLACYDGNTDASQLMERADRAMYADKNKGGRAARMVING